MTTYTLGNGAKVRTSAVRRFLIVGQYRHAKPVVETTTDDGSRASALIARYRRDYPFTTWTMIDQGEQGGK